MSLVTNQLFVEDLPGISNWWGILTIPILTYITIIIIEKRNEKNKKLKIGPDRSNAEVLTSFIGALVFGIVISILWEFGLENILQYLILLPIVIALFRPVHYAENLLGFAFGLLYTFGGILPILFGMVLILLSLFANKVIRNGFKMLVTRLK